MTIQRITPTLLAVLRCLMEADRAGESVHGWQIRDETGVLGPTVYGILGRLQEQRWVTEEPEEITPDTHRPRRRYYRLTDTGRTNGGALLSMRPAPTKNEGSQ